MKIHQFCWKTNISFWRAENLFSFLFLRIINVDYGEKILFFFSVETVLLLMIFSSISSGGENDETLYKFYSSQTSHHISL